MIQVFLLNISMQMCQWLGTKDYQCTLPSAGKEYGCQYILCTYKISDFLDLFFVVVKQRVKRQSSVSKRIIGPRGGVEVQLYSFFNLSCRWEWVVIAQYTSYRRLGGPQGWFGRVQKILTRPLGLNPQTVQSVVSHSPDYSVLIHMQLPYLNNTC